MHFGLLIYNLFNFVSPLLKKFREKIFNIIKDDKGIESDMRLSRVIKRYSGGGKDPNNYRNGSWKFYHCTNNNYANSFFIKPKISYYFSEACMETFQKYIDLIKVNHPLTISIKNNTISFYISTHSSSVDGKETLLVGIDSCGFPSYISEIFDKNIDLINDEYLLKVVLGGLCSLRELFESDNVIDYKPVVDKDIMYLVISEHAKAQNIEFDPTLESKDQIINKLDILINNVENRIELLKNKNASKND